MKVYNWREKFVYFSLIEKIGINQKDHEKSEVFNTNGG